MIEKLKCKETPLLLFLFISSFVVGLFNEWAGAVCTVVLTIMLLVRFAKEKIVKIGLNISTVSIAVIVLFFLASAIWAVDKYYAILGFVKFFPLLLFCLYLSQIDKDCKEQLFSYIPIACGIMTVVSLAFTKLGVAVDLFSVSSRISGFFQYSNTFALFLIIGIIIIAMKEKLKAFDFVLTVVLVAGVFFSGSRTSFILLVATVIALMFLSKNKSFKFSVVGFIVVAVISAVVYFSVTGTYGAFGRFLTISSSAGTFKGRLLYFKDALSVIAKHPLGLGYMGYYFSQGSFQTGVYSNQFVHNEFLQILLDIGWIPAVLVVVCFVINLFDKENSSQSKIIMCLIVAHSMMDFDLQFLSIAFILLICLNYDKNVKFLSFFSGGKIATSVVLALVCAVSLYFGSTSVAYVLGNSQVAVKIFPYNTMAQIELLKTVEDVEEQNIIADKIIAVDKSISNAYSSKALYYYSQGDVEKTIYYKELAIEKNRYYTEEYVDYCSMLITCISTYSEMGEYESAEYCGEKLLELQDTIDKVNDSTSSIAYDLQDKPDLELPQEYVDFIESIKA